MTYNLTLPEHFSTMPSTEQITQTMLAIMRQLEDILIAFMAQYGLLPDQVEQVEQHTANGIVWYVRKKTTKE